MTVKKHIKIISTLLCFLGMAVLLSSLYLIDKKWHAEDADQWPTLMIDRLLGDSGWEETKTYTNTKYGYKIDYPGRYLDALEVESPDSVGITWTNLGRTMEGWVSSLSFGDIEISVSTKNPNLSFESFKTAIQLGNTLIGTTTIAGYDAFILVQNPPADPSMLYTYCNDNRIIFFRKEDTFFDIRTCTINHQRVWNSFRFYK